MLAPQNSALIGLISTIIPAIAGGNTRHRIGPARSAAVRRHVVGGLGHQRSCPAASSIFSPGERSELIEHFASHMDVNAVIYCGDDEARNEPPCGPNRRVNVKRAICYDRSDWLGDEAQNPYLILDTQEIKTTWHPIGV